MKSESLAVEEPTSASELEEILKFDPLDAAEKLTGKSYKEDDGTGALGFVLNMAHSGIKSKVLQEMGDSTLSNNLDRYLEIVKGIGFEIALELPFMAKSSYDRVPRSEKFFMMIHREKGILLKFDTFCTDSVNGGDFYYCWKPKPDIDRGIRSNVLSSGGLESESDPDWRRNPKYDKSGAPDDAYCSGSHDCREAIVHKIKQLTDNGTFLSPWPKDPTRFLWFLHHQDTKEDGYDYKEINEERIKMLPQWARDVINK